MRHIAQPTVGSTRSMNDPRQWVEQHGDVLFRFALSRVRNAEVAEELVQETFLAGLAARQDFGQRSLEQTWLVAILKRKLADYLRRTRRSPTANERLREADGGADVERGAKTMSAQSAAWPDDPEAALERAEFWTAFRRCTSKLPAHLADAFWLREVDGLAADEVCQVLGITRANLWARLHRARGLLRECLGWTWSGKGV